MRVIVRIVTIGPIYHNLFTIGSQSKVLRHIEGPICDIKAELCQKVQKQHMLIYLVRISQGQQWDPSGYLATSTTVRSSQFKQWDP